jgi:hypothetical protein
MACAGRTWCDFVNFQPEFPTSMQLIVRRIERDGRHIAELETEVLVFLEETEARLQTLLTAYQAAQVFEGGKDA